MTSDGSTHLVPVAVNEGIGEGVSDLDFGNNVPIQSGHAYAMRVTAAATTRWFISSCDDARMTDSGSLGASGAGALPIGRMSLAKYLLFGGFW